MTHAYLTLEDLVARPPLPAIIAMLMVLGFKRLGERLCRWIFPGSREPLNIAICFVLTIAITAALLQLVMVIWRVPVQALRVGAWLLAALGLVDLWLICAHRNRGVTRRVRSFFLEQPPLERAAMLLLTFAALALACMALGPPSDADSLDYHLGVPLAWLRGGEAHPMYDWFHARLVGSGEVLNMLGLAGGTDILGAVLSAAGLCLLAGCLVRRVPTGRDRILILGCIITCPLLLFLLPNQKPFLLPAAANTFALLIIVDRFRTLDTRTLVGALGCIFFAMSCKYSFFLSGGIVLLATLAGAYASRRLAVAVAIALCCYAVMLFPMQWQKFLSYGDPISPMLERFKAHGYAPLVRFADYLRGYTMSSLPFPLSITIPYSLGSITSVLGAGSLACVVAATNVRRSTVLVVAASCSIAVGYAAGARSAAYYLEPYFWIAIAAASAPWGITKALFQKLVIAQAALMVCMAGFGAISLSPGSLTSGLRNQVMKENAHEYAVMDWLDAVLPQDAIVAGSLRSHALMPRPFIAKDIITWTDWNRPAEAEATTSLLRTRAVNTLIAEPRAMDELAARLGLRDARMTAGPCHFRTATRNPWNRVPEAVLAVYGARFASENGNVTCGSFSGR